MPLHRRNTVDPFVNGSGPAAAGGMKGSSSETFLTRIAEPPQEDFGLANGLNDLSNVVRHYYFKVAVAAGHLV